MQPQGPARPEPSPDLTVPDHDTDPAATGTSLDLPPSTPPPMPPPLAETTDAGSGPLGDLVVAHFRRVEIAMLGRVLITTLSGALPASMVQVEHRRSLGRRLSGRSGEPIGITVTRGERVLTFRSPEVGAATATVGHVVHGVVLATTPVSVAAWLDELGALLDGLIDDDEATRVALEQALLP